MDDVILRSLRGEISDVEQRLLRNWRREAAANEERYQELVRLWALQPAVPPGDPPARPPAARIIDIAATRRTTPLAKRSAWRRPPSARVLRYAAAAALAVTVPLAAVQFAARRGGDRGVAAAEFATAASETVTVSLTDGTFVRLAPRSRLRLSPAGREREVWLEGRAFFAVQTDSLHPFTVHTSAGDVLVRGTRFELRVEQESLRLAVVEGRVDVGSGGARVAVGAGEVSHVRAGQPPSVVRVDDVTQLIDWPGGVLIYTATPVEQVARELERHFDIPFVILDSKIAARAVTGSFTDQTLDEVVTAICRAVVARCVIEQQRVVVGP